MTDALTRWRTAAPDERLTCGELLSGDAVCELLPLVGAEVLEIGPGYGRVFSAARAHGPRTWVGIEPSGPCAEHCARLGMTGVVNCSVEWFLAIPPPGRDQLGGRWDVILGSMVLTHVPDVPAMLAGLWDMLTPGGVLWFDYFPGPARTGIDADGAWCRFWTPFELEAVAPGPVEHGIVAHSDARVLPYIMARRDS